MILELLSKLTGNGWIFKLTLDQKYSTSRSSNNKESVSEASKRSSHASRKSKTESLESKVGSVSSVKSEKFLLQKEEAALKAKLAFVEEEKKIRMEQKKAELIRVEQEERLEKLRLESELAQNQARLNVCILAEQEEMGVSVQDLNCVPSADKDKDMKKFLESLPVTNVAVPSPAHESPVHTPVQSKESHPTYGPANVKHEECSTPSAHVTPFGPHYLILEKCMDKLVETSSKLVAATMEQNQVNRQLAISGQSPKISIPVFNGIPYSILCGTVPLVLLLILNPWMHKQS